MERIQRLFAWNAWANGHTLDHLAGLDEVPPASERILCHIVGSERLWLSRLRQVQRGMAVWPKIPFADLRGAVETLASDWDTFLEQTPEGGLTRRIDYVNSKGEAWTSTTGDILTHTVLHSSYHRGQIATHLARAGHPPPYTDYIHGVRQGWI